MVTNITSLSRSGLWDWVIQRITAVVLAIYTLCVFGFLLANPHLTRSDLIDYFGNGVLQMFGTLALLSLAAHGWIGLWTVGTDYIQPHYFGRRSTFFRLVYQTGCIMTLFIYVLWGLQILWGR